MCAFVFVTCHSSHTLPTHEPLPNNDDNLNRFGNLPSLPWYSALLHMVSAILSFPYLYIHAPLLSVNSVHPLSVYIWQTLAARFPPTSLCCSQQRLDFRDVSLLERTEAKRMEMESILILQNCLSVYVMFIVTRPNSLEHFSVWETEQRDQDVHNVYSGGTTVLERCVHTQACCGA